MTEESIPTHDQLAGAIVKLRDEIKRIQKEADKKIAKLQEDKEKMESYLRDYCIKNKSKSISTENGTIMCRLVRKVGTTDWPAFYAWVVENDAFDCLEKRIKQSTMNQLIEEHEEWEGEKSKNPIEIPDGLVTNSEYKIVVRRS
jgi:hypothetical protein